MKAGSEVLELLSQEGLAMIANTNFIDPVLWAGSLLGGGVGVLWGELAGQIIPVPMWIPRLGGFLSGFLSVSTGLSLITSGTKTLLVAYAEDPAVLRSKKPELAQKWGEATAMSSAVKPVKEPR
jgi:hypothetical protein